MSVALVVTLLLASLSSITGWVVRSVPATPVVAGSVVTEGRVEIDSKARLLRNGVVVYEGTITSLRRFKDNVERVLEGLECGIGLTDYKDIKEGDVIEILGEVEIK